MLSVVIPPVSDCFMPTLGAAQISSYLKQRGIVAKLYDLGAELQTIILQHGEKLLESEELTKELSIVKKYILVTKRLFGENPIPFKISYDDFTSSWDWKNPDNLTELLSAHKTIIPYIELLPSLSELKSSQYIAFSISFESQLIPALLIAAVLQKHKKITVIWGGSFFYNYAEASIKLLTTLNIIDCLIIGPGERILESICCCGIHKTINSKEFVSSTLFGKIILQQKSTEQHPTVYLPDFKDLDFSRYFSSNHAFPFMIRNTCYYGSCKFCNGDRDCGIIESKNIKKAFQSISEIVRECDIDNVYIVDAALSPHGFQTIAAMDEPVSFSWIANARFEEVLIQEDLVKRLKQKGCRMLRFGLESGSQRVLNLMNKGTKVNTASSILKNVHSAGILTHIYLMYGYLGENQKDRVETLQFLKKNRHYIDSYSISIFQPIPKTPVYEEIKSKLHLPTNCGADEEYQRILKVIYPSEIQYQEILNSVEQTKNILAGFAHTNAEFYSANIFSENHSLSKKNDSLSIQFTPL